MIWVLAALAAMIVWCAGFVAGARKASRRTAVRMTDDYGQQYIRHVSDSGFVWYEVRS